MNSIIMLLFDNYFLKIFLKIGIIILTTLLINLIMKTYFRRMEIIFMRRKTHQEGRVASTRIKIIKIISSGVIYLVALLLLLSFIPGFRTFAISLLAGAGILAIVLGFAAQKSLANIISGISIAIYAPFRIGDKINVSGENGEVEDINLRQTVIRAWDNKRIIIPNSIISEKEVINYSLIDEKMLFTLDAGISYDSSIEKAREIMVKLANKHLENITFKEKDENNILVKKEPYVRLVSYGDFSINLRLYFWVKDNSKGYKMRHELLEQIKEEFDKNDIEVPFPYRTIVYKKDIERKPKKKKK